MNNPVTRTFARAALGAVGVAAAISFAPASALAQTTTIQGGGASLPAITLGELFACFSGTTPRPAVCVTAVNANVLFTYNSVGSGGGQRGWASQDPARLGGSPLVLDVNFGVSEAALTSSQLAAYNNGGSFSSTGPTLIANATDSCVSPATGNGADVAPSGGCYDNPRVENGAAIQLPIFGTPVTIAYDPVYKKVRNGDGTVSEYRYNNRYERADGTGGLRLTQTLVCQIFSGEITRWNDDRLTQANNGKRLWPADDEPVASRTADGRELRVVVRDDDSGTTSLIVRWARANCPQFAVASIPATGSIQTFPGNPTPGSISTANQLTTCDNNGNNTFAGFGSRIFYGRGNEGVAFCTNTPEPAATPGSTTVGGRMGYLGPDYTLPAVTNLPVGNVFRTFALNTASVENVAGRFVTPSPTSVTLALSSTAAPTGTDRANPLAWVASPDAIVGGAPNPITVPAGTTAYPIVGTTNFLLYTCYSSTAKQRAVAGLSGNGGSFMNWFYSNPSQVNTIVTSNGFAPLPASIRGAIVQNFLLPSNPAGTGLFIRARSAATASAGICSTGS